MRRQVIPGVFASTRNTEMPRCLVAPGSVRALTIRQGLSAAPEVNILLPSITKLSPSASARVRIAAASDPASASVCENANIISPAQTRGKIASFCSERPKRRSASTPQPSARLRNDAIASEARPNSSSNTVTSAAPPPAPPYRAGTGRPMKPAAAMPGSSSIGARPAQSASTKNSGVSSRAM